MMWLREIREALKQYRYEKMRAEDYSLEDFERVVVFIPKGIADRAERLLAEQEVAWSQLAGARFDLEPLIIWLVRDWVRMRESFKKPPGEILTLVRKTDSANETS